ncbi:MAG: neutral/alkaline non-lysosomal ceramidase N-terminal domain-containing protein [Clostridia bacterium]|nr:neutral/alkaline non-lysosomal ceramidase N-terminal domain-containing protein [Clostridia bacterium]
MFKAGFARLDMTPPLGSPMAGYFEYREAEGILDPLELNAVAVSDGENTVLIVTADILMANEVFSTNVRGVIAERTGVPAGNIFLQGLHQHTSVFLGATAKIKGQNNSFYDATYQNVLVRKYADICVMAMDDMAKAAVSIASKETAVPISLIRRYRMADGSTKTNPGRMKPDVLYPVGESDNTVRLVKFEREGKKDIALVNFSTHPDTVGGKKYSADWPGFVRRMTEKDLGVHCILVNGAQGDTNHVDVSKPAIAKKDDPDFFEKRYAYTRFMGRTVADVVVDVWNKTETVPEGKVSGGVEMVYIPTNTKYMERVDEFRAKKELMDEGLIKLTLDEKGEVNRVASLRDETLFRKVPVSMVAFGKVALIGFGGEPFTEYATRTRASAPDLFVICACCTNGGQGYLPTKSAFEEGGYEARSSRFTPCVADLLPETAAALLKAHQEG